jgi:hypothetical protein
MILSRNLALGLLATFALAASSRALEWKATTLSVTTAPFQTTQDATFEFKNNGGKPVTIRDIETSCDCLDATADPKVYPPGASGVIKARFTVGDRIGLYERIVTVVTDEPGESVRLLLKIEVPPAALLEPRSVVWQLNEATTEKSIDLQPAAGLEITFNQAETTNDAFTVRLATVEPGRHYVLYLKPRDTTHSANTAVRIYGREKSGHEVLVSAYADVQ